MDFRALLLTALAAFAIAALLGPICIPFLHRLKFGQSIRDEGPKHHQKKSGTPTMGGILIVIAVILTTLRFASTNVDVLLILFTTVAFGLIGFADDFIKVVKKRNLGLRAGQKLFWQTAVTVVVFVVMWYVRGRSLDGFSVSVPFTSVVIPMGIFYLLFLFFVLVGTSNGVNLTDGLDGLLAGCAAIVFIAYAIYAMWHTEYNVAIFCASMVGALLGFLVHNRHPARVFMGDTGSLAIGGALAMVAVLTHTELGLVLFGLVFVVETLSVILQVASFKAFGRRIFRMSPLHHHFELLGWSEWEVVLGFWLATFLTAFGTLALFSRLG